MKTSRILTIVLLLISFHSSAQQKNILKFQSHSGKLFVMPGGQMAIATRSGEVAFSEGLHQLWTMRPPTTDVSGYRFGATIGQVNFFNRDTGIASGFIRTKAGKYDIIFRTTDNGQTWEAINFGMDGWVDDAINLDNGEAWMSVSGEGIAYSNDYGRSWKKMDIPDKRHRFTAIFFNSKKEGIIGSLSNVIAITADNCRNWTNIPTPLTQKKYSKTYRDVRPDITRVAIYNNYYLAVQEEMVFFTSKENINWKWMPQYTDFFTDPANSALYFRKNNGGFVYAGDDLQPVQQFDSNFNCTNGYCRNGALYVKNEEQVIRLQPGVTIASSYINTNDTVASEPQTIGNWGKKVYGAIGKSIFVQDHNFVAEWVHAFDLPFEIGEGNLALADSSHIILYLSNDSLLYYNFKTGEKEIKNATALLENFCKSTITRIIFENGTQGCFHHNLTTHIYERDNEGFRLVEQRSVPADNKANAGTSRISAKMVDDLVSGFPVSIKKDIAFSSLGFTNREFEQCITDIKKLRDYAEGRSKKNTSAFYFGRNNIDFDKLLTLVDSIPFIQPPILNEWLSYMHPQAYSTTSYWDNIRLINGQGKEMRFYSYYYEANPFHFPWYITVEGNGFQRCNTEITNLLHAALPSNNDEKGRIAVLHYLVTRLYTEAMYKED